MADRLEVPFSAAGFPSTVRPRGTLTLTADDLAHALFVTGRAPGDQTRHGLASVWEFIHRASVIPAYLRRSPTGAVHKSGLAQDLDRSEKVALSYALGQALTGVYCRQQLGVRFLMHLDRYQGRYGLTFGTGRKRPDLFGWTSGGDWIVAEAKGRSNGMESGLPAKLAAQKSMVRTIAGASPKLALGCVATFPVLYAGTWDRLRVDVVDPPQAEKAVDIEVEPNRFLRAYFEPFEAALTAGELDDGDPNYVIARLPGLGVRVGVLRSIHDLMAQQNEQGVDALLVSLSALETELAGPYFPDGTFVETTWNDALAIRDHEGA
jgi:hypothetical protein